MEIFIFLSKRFGDIKTCLTEKEKEWKFDKIFFYYSFMCDLTRILHENMESFMGDLTQILQENMKRCMAE